MREYNNTIDKKTFKKNKEFLAKHRPELIIDKNSFIFRAYTKDQPYYHSYQYVFPNDKFHPKDTIPVIDSVEMSMIYSVPTKDNKGQFVHLIVLDGMYHNNLRFLRQGSGGLYYIFPTYLNIKETQKEVDLNPFSIAQNAIIPQANYLAAIEHLEHYQQVYTTKQDKWMHLQASLTYNSFVQNNKQYSKLLDQHYKKPDKEIEIKAYNADAINYILDASKDKWIVMFNESHWMPRHRYLANTLLKSYYDMGFRYLAMEAIHENDSLLNERKYPVQTTGVYSKEPQMANLIRNALRMGFTLVQYDDYSKEREYMQARNIYDKTIKQDKDAKVLALAGIGHISKGRSGKLMMGAQLADISGLDPLSINQHIGDYYAHLTIPNKLAVSIDDKDISDGNYDMRVYNNLNETQFRINSEAEDTTHYTHILSKELREEIKTWQHLLLSIYIKKEFEEQGFDNAIPVINYLLDDYEAKDPVFILPKEDSYYLIIRKANAEVVEAIEL